MSVLKKTMRLEALRLDEDDEYCVARFVGFHDEESGDAYDDSMTEVTFTVEEARALGEHMFETFELTVAPMRNPAVDELVRIGRAGLRAARRGLAEEGDVSDATARSAPSAEQALTDCAIDYLRNLSPDGKWDEKLVKEFMERSDASAILAEHVVKTTMMRDGLP